MGEGGRDKRADRQADLASIRLQVDVVNRLFDPEEETTPYSVISAFKRSKGEGEAS